MLALTVMTQPACRLVTGCALSCRACIAPVVMTAPARPANALGSSRTAGIWSDVSSAAPWPRTVPIPCTSAAAGCGAFPFLFSAPGTVFPPAAVAGRPPARTAPVRGQAPGTRPGTPALARANARRNVDSPAAPSAAGTSGPASPARCPIAANDRDPAITAAIPADSSPASPCRRPRLFRGPGTRAGRSGRSWLRAAETGEDVIGGRASLAADDGEREELPSFRPGPARRPRTRRARHPLLQHRRSQPQFTTLPCPCSGWRPIFGVNDWAQDLSCCW